MSPPLPSDLSLQPREAVIRDKIYEQLSNQCPSEDVRSL